MSEPQVDTVATSSITDAYINEDERVLDPTVLDKSLIERMPEPSGWRLLVLPYKGKGVTDGGIQLLESTMDKEKLSTAVCYVIKIGPLAYQDASKFNGVPWCKKGDWILISRYAGARFQLEDNHEVRIINDDEVIGTILDPNDIKSA